MAPKTYWEVSARELGMEDIEGEKAGVRLGERHSLIRKTMSGIERLFIPMGEDEEGTIFAAKGTVDGAGGGMDKGEKKVEKADEEVEEILAHL